MPRLFAQPTKQSRSEFQYFAYCHAPKVTDNNIIINRNPMSGKFQLAESDVDSEHVSSKYLPPTLKKAENENALAEQERL